MILFLAQLLSRRTNADVGSTVGHMGLERALLHTDSYTEFSLKFNPLNLWIKFGISVELDRVGDDSAAEPRTVSTTTPATKKWLWF